MTITLFYDFIGHAYQCKDIVFRLIVEQLKGFWPPQVIIIIIGLFFIWEFLKDDILACVETCE